MGIRVLLIMILLGVAGYFVPVNVNLNNVPGATMVAFAWDAIDIGKGVIEDILDGSWNKTRQNLVEKPFKLAGSLAGGAYGARIFPRRRRAFGCFIGTCIGAILGLYAGQIVHWFLKFFF